MAMRWLFVLALVACGKPVDKPKPQTIRVAVIGGMVETGFWPAVIERYEKASPHSKTPRG